jgi:flavin-dependent dehydrogenase
MDRRDIDTEVAIIGGGPAGTAAAIACAQQGLRVWLFERATLTGDRVGEALHPGVEPVLRQLGVAASLPLVTGARHEGIWVDWGGRRRFEPYGHDADGPWRGFQVVRAAFDALLLDRARELGVAVMLPCAVTGLCREGGRVAGIDTASGPVRATVTIDATGRTGWLSRKLAIASIAPWPRLFARYGYRQGDCPTRDTAPSLVGRADGWQWTALVRPGVYQWLRVTQGIGRGAADEVPSELAMLAPLGPVRGADVTWRIGESVAGPGWFSVGDAAALLDPAASRGVLKALLSGLGAGHLIAATLRGRLAPDEAARTYDAWLRRWFAEDAARLATFYRELGVPGFDAVDGLSPAISQPGPSG